ncbi:hypothetical protein BAY59_24365 [Prauserella coralliicola]|nr:hypothetical protein BAY59_24365 [Prauserella coralliicola]
MAAKFTAIRWAREVPTQLHQGRVDRLGHHLLLLLATYARNDGTDAHPSTATLAKEVHASEREVLATLDRLEAACLIRADHGSNGIPGWSLNLEVRSEVDPVVEDRVARRRAADRERQRRRRERLKVDSHATVDRDVTENSTVTEKGVTQELPVSHAQVDRDKADVTQELGVSHGSETVTTAGQGPHNSLLNSQKKNSSNELPPIPDGSGQATLIQFPTSKPQPEPSGYTEAFEAAWLAYGRRGTKKAAFREWQKAIKRVTPGTITAAIPAYVASTPNPQYRQYLERWLRDDGWESAPVPAKQAAGSWQPYQNPTDQSVYDEPL